MVVIGRLPALKPSIDTSKKKKKHRASSTYVVKGTPDKKKTHRQYHIDKTTINI